MYFIYTILHYFILLYSIFIVRRTAGRVARRVKPAPGTRVSWNNTYGALFLIFFFAHFYFPASGQGVVTGVVPSSPRFVPSIFIAHRRVQQSRCLSISHRVLLTHALALSTSQFVHKKKSPQVNLCTRKSPHEFMRACTRGYSNSRN